MEPGICAVYNIDRVFPCVVNSHGDVYLKSGFAYGDDVMSAIGNLELAERSTWWLSRYAHVEIASDWMDIMDRDGINRFINFSRDYDNLSNKDKIDICNASYVAEQCQNKTNRLRISNNINVWQAGFVKHMNRARHGLSSDADNVVVVKGEETASK